MQPYKIFNKNFKSKNIKKVFEESIRNKPSIGLDGINITVFEKKLDIELDVIHRKIMNKTSVVANFQILKMKEVKNKF